MRKPLRFSVCIFPPGPGQPGLIPIQWDNLGLWGAYKVSGKSKGDRHSSLLHKDRQKKR